MNLIFTFILGLAIGAGLAWYLLEQYRTDDAKEREAQHEARLKQLQEEVLQADSAHAETKERLIALQLEQKAIEQRTQPLEAELEQARRAARQAMDLEAQLRRRLEAAQEELARLKGGEDAASVPVPPELPPPAPLVAMASAPGGPGDAAGDDLTRIKGIGKVMQKKLNELGITHFRQLAELSGPEIRKINEAIEFPGRVEREHWVQQARDLMGP